MVGWLDKNAKSPLLVLFLVVLIDMIGFTLVIPFLTYFIEWDVKSTRRFFSLEYSIKWDVKSTHRGLFLKCFIKWDVKSTRRGLFWGICHKMGH